MELLRAQPVFTLFLIFGIGYLIGKIRIGVPLSALVGLITVVLTPVVFPFRNT
jgi:hypothetical protein